MRKLLRYCVGLESEGQRLDKYIPSQAEELSRGQLRRIVDLGGVHIDGRRVRKCSQTLHSGNQVEVYLDGLPLEPFRLSEDNIIYRDQDLLAINKPAGVESQPTHARYKGTLYEALLVFLQDPYRMHQKPALGMVQRLDRDTSGIMVFSVHPRAHKGLTKVFTGRDVKKSYRAIVAGRPAVDRQEIRSLLARQRKSNRVKSVAAGGKEAVTRYSVLERFPSASLLEIEIFTGRSHQIRAHLAELGHPLLGDSLYGGPIEIAGASVGRQMLHAAQLCFDHPISAEMLDLKAPLPLDMLELLTHLRSAS